MSVELDARGSANPVTIRVIEVKRRLTDVASAGAEELGLLLAAAASDPALAEYAAAVMGFREVSHTLRGPLAEALAVGAPPAGAAPGGLQAALRIRALLGMNPAVRPVLGGGPDAGDDRGIVTRAASRVRGIGEGGRDVAIAAEEPLRVVGLVVDPRAAGALTAAAGPRRAWGQPVLAASGSYTAADFAAEAPPRPPEAPKEAGARRGRRAGFIRVGGLGSAAEVAAAAEALLRHAHAAAGYYFSGAAAAVASAVVGAAAGRRAGALPELLAALAPQREPVLAAAVSLGRAAPRPPWRGADASGRLRYLLERLARVEPVAAKDPGTWAQELAPLFDLYRLGAFGVYLHALTEGRESAAVDAFLVRAAHRRAAVALRAAAAAEARAAAALVRSYLQVAEDKFGGARARALLEALRAEGGAARASPGAALALFSAREREVVETELEGRRQAWAAAAGNRCPHVALARRLRAATSAAGALAALRGLEAYFAPDAGRSRALDAAAGAGAAPKGAPPTPESLWLRCRSCNFRALCPHVRERVRLEARRAPYEDVRAALQKYAVRVASAEGDAYTYFCRVCSERLGDTTTPEEEKGAPSALGRFGALGAGLRARTWALALGAAPHVRFPVPTDERLFAGVVADAVHPLLVAAVAAEASPRRAAGAAAPGWRRGAREVDPLDEMQEEVPPQAVLHAALFVYAYILSLVQSSQGSLAAVGFADVKAGARASVYAERMLRRLSDDLRGVISQVEGAGPEYIKKRFEAAYRLVRSEGGAGLQAASPEEELAYQVTALDPVYRYAATIARVVGALPAGRPAGPADAKREFELVLGAGLPELVRLARESARDPALAPLYLRRVGVSVPLGGELDFLLKGPRVNLYARLFEAGAAPGPALAAFRAAGPAPGAALGGALAGVPRPGGALAGPPGGALAGVPRPGGAQRVGGGARQGAPARRQRAPPRARKEGAAVRSQAGPRGPALAARPRDRNALAAQGEYFEAYRLFAQYTKRLVSREAQSAYLSELAEYRRAEGGLRAERALDAVLPCLDFGFAPREIARTARLTAIFDEGGVRHDWSKRVGYLYAAGDGRLVEVKGGPAAVMAAREAGTVTPGMALVDLICPDCGVRQSAVGSLDEEKTARAVRAASELAALFIFYEVRCPAGGLHTWDSAGCARCGLTVEASKEALAGRPAEGGGARAYYDRYAEAFASVRSAARALPAPAPVPASAEAPRVAWSPDYTLVVRAAELAGPPPAAVEAIGSTEGREYADVLEGRDAPAPPTEASDPRIYAADAEVRSFLANYAALRAVGRVSRPKAELAALLAASSVPPHELGLIPGALPEVAGADYHRELAALAREDPAAALSFAIQSLCRFVLEVATGGGPRAPGWATPLGAAFARAELVRILQGQRRLAAPGAFNWGIFGGEDEEGGLAAEGEQAGDVGEDVLAALLEAEAAGEEPAEDPFSGEHIDYDTGEGNPNNEPA
jgi:hypothetical protein